MSKFKHILLAVAIAIVFVFFVGFGVASFYKSPKYLDFCEEGFVERPYPRPLEKPENCTFIEAEESLKKISVRIEEKLPLNMMKMVVLKAFIVKLVIMNIMM